MVDMPFKATLRAAHPTCQTFDLQWGDAILAYMYIGLQRFAKAKLPTCLQISPAGHCPHHEAPTAVHEAMIGWLQAVETSTSLPWAVGEQRQYQHVTVTHVDGSPRNIFEKVDVVWFALRQRLFGKHAVVR